MSICICIHTCRKSLLTLGSTADFIVMLGFTTLGDSLDYSLYKSDLALLEDIGIRLLYLPRLRAEHRKVSFTEMALLKITPWNLEEYDKLQFFDGDILPLKSMDNFFKYNIPTFNSGNASPLNSGWFLMIPNKNLYEKMYERALNRTMYPWSEKQGWGTPMPGGVYYRGGIKKVEKWNFNGASLDQGLLFYTYAVNNVNYDTSVVIIDDIKGEAIKYLKGNKQIIKLDVLFQNSDGVSPISSFAHFTGRSKPWLQNLDKTKAKPLIMWKKLLDNLRLPINSTNYRLLGTKPPLGFFASNK